MLQKIQKGRMAITNKELKQSQNLIKRHGPCQKRINPFVHVNDNDDI